MATRKTIDILAENINLNVVSSKKTNIETKHVLTIEIIWPRPTIQTKTYARVITLQKGSFSPAEGDWLNRILAKETTEGKFGVKISISSAMTNDMLNKFFKNLFKVTFGLIGDAVEDIPSSKLTGKLLSTPFDFIASNIEITEEVIAACELVIDTNSFKKDAMQNTITLPLIAAKDFVKTINKPVATKGARQTKKQVLLHEGDNNGSISLTISAS